MVRLFTIRLKGVAEPWLPARVDVSQRRRRRVRRVGQEGDAEPALQGADQLPRVAGDPAARAGVRRDHRHAERAPHGSASPREVVGELEQEVQLHQKNLKM